jgi:hypothetical protein
MIRPALSTSLVPLALALLGACAGEPSPKEAPLGVRWGADTASAEKHLLDNGFRRDDRVDISDRSLGIIHTSYFGGPFLGIASKGSSLIADGEVSYSLIFDRGRMRSVSVIYAFADSVERAHALEAVTKKLATWWRGKWSAGPIDDQLGGSAQGSRIWPIEDSVSVGVTYETVPTPAPNYMLSIGFDRVATAL